MALNLQNISIPANFDEAIDLTSMDLQRIDVDALDIQHIMDNYTTINPTVKDGDLNNDGVVNDSDVELANMLLGIDLYLAN